MNEVTKKRNTGLDLLKIISMILVVLTHILTYGGILYNTTRFSINYEVSWLLQSLCYCAVTCYALISGYIGIDTEFKYSRIIQLWLNVLFYNIIITSMFFILKPELISKLNILKVFFPILFKQHWYFSAYFCMFFFIPYFNILLNKLNKKQGIKLIITIILLFSICTMISPKDIFNISYGFSPLWITLLYLIGGCIKKHNLLKKCSNEKLILGFISLATFTWVSKYLIEIFYLNSLGIINDGNFFLKYNSITIIFESIFLLVLFSRIKIKNSLKLIQYIASSTFSVYIIHMHPLILEYTIKNRFIGYIAYPFYILIVATISGTLLICIISVILDIIRKLIFKKIKINKFSNYIVEKITKLTFYNEL